MSMDVSALLAPEHDDGLILADIRNEVAPDDVVAIPRLRVHVQREGGKTVERVVELEGDHLRIGSHASNELVILDPKVARFHCVLSLARGSWILRDTDPANGTVLSGVRVREAALPPRECQLALADSLLFLTPLAPEKVRHTPALSSFGALRGVSLVMREVFRVLEQVAASDTGVLIHGESGTGKGLVARELAKRGTRGAAPFIGVDASALSAVQAEDVLFGKVRGPGADRALGGAFEAAQGGTLFLEEVGELPLAVQKKLLRALESGQVRRAGEDVAQQLDVRLIASTSRDLEREVNRGTFDDELYAKLAGANVRLPPLRERVEEIPSLVRDFLDGAAAAEAESLFTPEVYERLGRHDWYGNVRELRTYVERVVAEREAGHPARASSLPPSSQSRPSSAPVSIELPFKTAKERVIVEFERAYLAQIMAWAQGNVSRASRKALIDRMYLHRLLQRYSITRDGSGS